MSFVKTLFRPPNSAQSGIVVRAGRLMHWVGLSFALLACIAAIAFAMDSYQSSISAQLEIQKWEKNNTSRLRKDGQQLFSISSTDGHVWEIAGPPGSTRDEAIEHLVQQGTDRYLIEDRPYERTLEVFESLAIALVGLVAFFVGRAIRYLLAGE